MKNSEFIKNNLIKMDEKTLAGFLLVISKGENGELVYTCSDGTNFSIDKEKEAYEYQVWWLKQEYKKTVVN